MADNLRIKSVFISSVLRETAQLIQRKQEQTAKEWSLFNSGELERNLKGHFSVNAANGGGHLTMRYLAYTRFLDMKNPNRKVKREGYHLYNRIVFGVLYNPTVNALQYGFTDEIRNFIGEKVKEAITQKMPVYKITDVVLKHLGETDRNLAAIFSKSLRTG